MLSDFRATSAGFGDEASSCLGRSCMKWGEDGELSPIDLHNILQRLCAVDEQAASQMLKCSL